MQAPSTTKAPAPEATTLATRCPPFEENVDYLSDQQVDQLEGVASPGACREMCDAEPQCDVWAWGDIRDVPGLTDFCFLKVLEKTKKLKKMSRLGVISGLSCSSFKATGDLDELEVVAAADASRPIDSTKVISTAILTPAEQPDTDEDELVQPPDTDEEELVGPSPEVDCLVEEENVEYKTGESLAEVEVGSAASCRAACEDFKGCGAWTWGAARHVPGLTDMCYIKGAAASKPVGQLKQGVVSGWPCSMKPGTRSTSAQLASTAAAAEASSASSSSTALSERTKTSTTAPPTTPTSKAVTSTTTAAEATTLFCWCLCMPTGYEPSLLRFQRKHNSSIFGCEETAVYSNRVFEVAPGVKTLKVDSDLKAVYGGEFYTALNTWIFLKVWDRVIDDATYAEYDWTVKVDPDAVFFPGRLRKSLVRYGEAKDPGSVYINNCKYGLHGPIEVFSAGAIKAFAKDRFKCVQHIDTGCDGGPCEWGEDLFLDECLEKVLHIRRDNIYDLMIETACDPPGGEVDCKNHSAAVYHPFKSVEEYSVCLDEAQR